jgi:diguanylate cyclase (GGDEF)-like protein/PAS domain S-box-containing protein
MLFYSCFISYGRADKWFERQMHDTLRGRGPWPKSSKAPDNRTESVGTVTHPLPLITPGIASNPPNRSNIVQIASNAEPMSARGTEEDLLKTFLQHIPDGVYFKDRHSRFVRISRSLALRFGLDDPAEAMNKTDFDMFSEEHAKQAFDDEQEIVRTGQPIVDKEERETWPDGGETWVLSTKLPLRDGSGNIIGTMGISRDITERKRVERELQEYRTRLEDLVGLRTAELQRANELLEKDIAARKVTEQELALKAQELAASYAVLHNLSQIDDLTGLYNRKGFLAIANHRMKLASRNAQAFSVAFIDLDGLKKINDTLGHETGNRALIELTGVLKKSFRQSDILGRLGGDEFAVFIGEADESETDSMRRRVQQHLDACNAQPDRSYQLSFSIGIVSTSQTESLDIEALLGRADALMYQHKRAKSPARNSAASAQA